MNSTITKSKDKIYDNWHFAMAIVFDVVAAIFVKYYEIHFWEAKHYSDMLTAIITFVSIIMSVFGVLMPTVFTGNSEMANYFKRNADIAYFAKSVKHIIICGFGSIACICGMYLSDEIPMNILKAFGLLGGFSLCSFSLGAYRYLGIMLRLLIENKEEYKGKTYKKRISEQDRKELNDILKKQNK